jgi:hypothetical protein
MTELTIKTNNQPRQPMSGLTLELFVGQRKAAKIRRDYDYLTDEEFENEDFIDYRGQVYAMSDFMRFNFIPEVDDESPYHQWDGYINDTYFSGVLIKLCDDGDVIMGRYYR